MAPRPSFAAALPIPLLMAAAIAASNAATAGPPPPRASAPAAAAPAPAAAPAGSLRAEFVKESAASIDVIKDGVRVSGYRFARAVRGAGRPFHTSAEPAILFDVKNEGTARKELGLAVALFDREGRLVGAGSASHSGRLDPGETQEVKVVFRDVTQEVGRAATIFMTIEVQP